jgi:D-sedoheptulose 7-phosphate isomerase
MKNNTRNRPSTSFIQNELIEWIENYKKNLSDILKGISAQEIYSVIEKFIIANRNEKNIFIFGNGGSASTSSHFTTDMAKGASDLTSKRFKTLSLNENVSLITAISNDYSYEDIFFRQLENLAKEGDLLFTLSVSGNSKNLLKAVDWANKNGIHSIAVVGGHKGKLADLATQSIVIDSMHYGHVEDIHLIICHIIAYAFMENPQITNTENILNIP